MQVGARVALGLTWSRTLTCILSQLESTRRASLHVAWSAKSSGMLPLATSHSTSSVRSEKGIVAKPFQPERLPQLRGFRLRQLWGVFERTTGE